MPETKEEGFSTRDEGQTVDHDRAAFIGFTTDSDTISAVKQGLEDILGGTADIRQSSMSAAISTLEKQKTPRVILVDISNESDPLEALSALSGVVEPDVRVFVVGENKDINFYRELVHTMGVADYLFKPLTAELVARLVGPVFTASQSNASSLSGGRRVAVTGASGGVGTSTIALSLAHYLSDDARRHTLIFDPDLHMGAIATMLGAQTQSNLKMILEAPRRVDSLVITRTVQTINDRLSLLAGEESMESTLSYTESAIKHILNSIGRRYNVIISDTPLQLGQISKDLLDFAHQRVIVFEPTLISVRNTIRLMGMPRGAEQVRRPLLVLNKHQQPGALTLQQIEDVLNITPDAIVPYIPRQIIQAANLGENALSKNIKFKQAITQLAREINPQTLEVDQKALYNHFSFLKNILKIVKK